MGYLNRLVAVEENEVRPMLWAVAYYFLLLASYFVIRPIRDDIKHRVEALLGELRS